MSETKYLARAARQCMRRASSPGADRVTWHDYRQNFRLNLENLQRRLRNGTWEPGLVRHARVRVFTGKEISLEIPPIEDRIVHRAIRNAVEPILEESAFMDFVSGFRPKRSRLTSVRQAMHYHAQGFKYAADVDVAKVSQGVEIEEVVNWMAKWVSDGSFLKLFRIALTGLPSPMAVGSGLSPLLINLRLVPVDNYLADVNVVRFADNYCIFCKTRAEAELAFDKIGEALRAVNLSPSVTKSCIRLDFNPEDLFLISG